MFTYKDVKSFNKTNLCYLCDEKGKKIVNVAFDEVRVASNHTVFYKIGNKYNIVTEEYFLSHPKRSEIIKNCKYSNYFSHDGFRVLLQDVVNGVGLKIIENNGNITTIDNAVLVGNGSRYIVYHVYGTYSYQAIYSSSEGVKHYTIPELKTDSKGIFDLEEFFNEHLNKVETKQDLIELINFYRCILLEDIKEFDKSSHKYIIIKNAPQIIRLTNDKPLQDYRLDNASTHFKTPEEAKENATKIIKVMKQKVMNRLNKQQEEEQKISEEDAIQKGLIQKACEAFTKSTMFKR